MLNQHLLLVYGGHTIRQCLDRSSPLFSFSSISSTCYSYFLTYNGYRHGLIIVQLEHSIFLKFCKGRPIDHKVDCLPGHFGCGNKPFLENSRDQLDLILCLQINCKITYKRALCLQRETSEEEEMPLITYYQKPISLEDFPLNSKRQTKSKLNR